MIRMAFNSLIKRETLAIEIKISIILALKTKRSLKTKRRLKIMRRILDLL